LYWADHANECNVNIFERAHLRDTLGVAGEVKALATIGEHVTIASPYRDKLAGLGAANEVVHGDSFYCPPAPGLGLAVGDNGRRVDVLATAGGAQITVFRFAQGRNSSRVHMVAVNITDKNKVRRRKTGCARKSRRVNIDNLMSASISVLAE